MAAAKTKTWGGKRPGAGRKPADPTRLNVPHRARPPHDPSQPVHATFRRAKGLPTLRSSRMLESFLRCATTYNDEDEFRVVHLTSDTEHLHVIVEAATSLALQRGLQSLAIRTARNVNMILERTGPLWDDRFAQAPITSAAMMSEVLARYFGKEHATAIASPQTTIAQEGWVSFLKDAGVSG